MKDRRNLDARNTERLLLAGGKIPLLRALSDAQKAIDAEKEKRLAEIAADEEAESKRLTSAKYALERYFDDIEEEAPAEKDGAVEGENGE
jgi:hypothetical protein